MTRQKALVSFDWAMRSILRDKANFDILEGFLTTLLGREITVLSLLESKDNQPHSLDRFYRLDLLVEDEEGMNSIVQIQHDLESQYLQCLLFGTSKLIVENLRLEKRLSHVRKVISIRILYLLLGDGKDDYIYHGRTEFRGMTSGRSLKSQANRKSPEAEEANLFPEYYLIKVGRFNDEIKSELDEWIYFFKNFDILESFRAKNIQVAREKLARRNLTPAQQRRYDQYLINLAISKDIVSTARAEAKAKGRLEGWLETIAKKMLNAQEPLDKIMRYTGLDEAELERLSNPQS